MPKTPLSDRKLVLEDAEDKAAVSWLASCRMDPLREGGANSVSCWAGENAPRGGAALAFVVVGSAEPVAPFADEPLPVPLFASAPGAVISSAPGPPAADG